MSSFNAPLICEDSDNEKYRRVYVEFSYERGRLGSGNLISVGKGFITDGASVPEFFWGWPFNMSPWGAYAKAAVLHDLLYAAQTFTRLECDNIFLEAMMALKVNSFKANVMFKMVRWFAQGAWDDHTRLGHPAIIAAGGFPTYPDAIFTDSVVTDNSKEIEKNERPITNTGTNTVNTDINGTPNRTDSDTNP